MRDDALERDKEGHVIAVDALFLGGEVDAAVDGMGPPGDSDGDGVANNVDICPDLRLDDGIQAVRLSLDATWFDAAKCERGIEDRFALVDRGVGGDHDHNRTVCRSIFRLYLNRHSLYVQHTAKVGLHKGAYGISTQRLRQ